MTVPPPMLLTVVDHHVWSLDDRFHGITLIQFEFVHRIVRDDGGDAFRTGNFEFDLGVHRAGFDLRYLACEPVSCAECHVSPLVLFRISSFWITAAIIP
jgi:hypothetical protein